MPPDCRACFGRHEQTSVSRTSNTFKQTNNCITRGHRIYPQGKAIQEAVKGRTSCFNFQTIAHDSVQCLATCGFVWIKFSVKISLSNHGKLFRWLPCKKNSSLMFSRLVAEVSMRVFQKEALQPSKNARTDCPTLPSSREEGGANNARAQT